MCFKSGAAGTTWYSVREIHDSLPRRRPNAKTPVEDQYNEIFGI